MLEEKDEVIIAHALNMWANYVETGSTLRSAIDTARINDGVDIARPLDLQQMKLVIRLRELAHEILLNEGI